MRSIRSVSLRDEVPEGDESHLLGSRELEMEMAARLAVKILIRLVLTPKSSYPIIICRATSRFTPKVYQRLAWGSCEFSIFSIFCRRLEHFAFFSFLLGEDNFDIPRSKSIFTAWFSSSNGLLAYRNNASPARTLPNFRLFVAFSIPLPSFLPFPIFLHSPGLSLSTPSSAPHQEAVSTTRHSSSFLPSFD